MGIRSLLRTEYGQCIKNKAITHNLDTLSHAAILATGENPEETDPGWTRMEELSTQLTELHSQEMVLNLELSEAQKVEAELLATQQLLAELQANVPSSMLPGFSQDDWAKDNAAASARKANKEQEPSSTSQKLPAPRLTGPWPANVAQAVVMRLKRRAVTAQMCQDATDKVSAIKAKLRDIHEQQQEAFNELVQGWQTVLEKAYSKGGSACQQAVEVVLAVHPDADKVQQLQEALIQSQMQLAAAREEAAAARARAEAAHAAHAALLQQQETASAVAVNLIIQEPSISLSLNVIEPQRQQQDEGVVQLLQDRLAEAEAELMAVKHQQRPVTLQVLVSSDAAELEGLCARLAAAEADLAAARQAEHLQHTDKGDEVQSQGGAAAAGAAPAAAAALVPCAGSVSEAQPATPRVDLGLCGQQLAMVAGQASVAASSSAASYESCCDSSSVHGSVCNGSSSSKLGDALSCERVGAAASAAGDAGGLEVAAVEEKAPAVSKAEASAADGANQQPTAPVTAASSKQQQQTGAAAGDESFDSNSGSSKWLEIVVAADFVADQCLRGHHQQQKQQQDKPRVSDDLNPDGLQDKDSGCVLAMLRSSVMEGCTTSGGAGVETEAVRSTAGASNASAAAHSSSNGSRGGRYTCMPFTAPPAAAILVGSVGFTAALADKMGLLPAGPAGGSWAGGLWSAVNDASCTAASSVGGWINRTWGGWQ